MFNPRHSFISTSSATTYPSTLSPPQKSSAPLHSPTSPRHPHRLHRSSKRNLRTSASSSALKSIIEDGKGRSEKTLSQRMSILAIPGADRPTDPPKRSITTSPAMPAIATTARPDNYSLPPSRIPSRSMSVETVKEWARTVDDTRKEQSRPTSTVQPTSSTVKPKSSRDVVRLDVPGQSKVSVHPMSTGLGLNTGQPLRPVQNPLARVAQPRKPEPINVNPRKKQDSFSFADEWERELIQSAKNPHYVIPETKGKGREVQKDIEWEKSGRWQADVDPAREAEDRQRRDNGREIGE